MEPPSPTVPTKFALSSIVVKLAAERSGRWATTLHLGAALGSVVAGLVLAWGVANS